MPQPRNAVWSSLIVLAPIFALACKPAPEFDPPVAQPDASHPDLTQYDPPPMEVHFVHANDMQKAVIDGDLDVARAHAQWIVDNTVSDELPMRWRGDIPRVVEAAQQVVDAADLSVAAKGAAQMAGSCGACHDRLGVPLDFSEAAAPPDDDGGASHMRRHQWGVDRLWEGLVGPSDASWRAGAKALLEAPLRHEGVGEVDAETQVVADQVHALASSAVSVTDQRQRAGLYGDLLGTCVGCHGPK